MPRSGSTQLLVALAGAVLLLAVACGGAEAARPVIATEVPATVQPIPVSTISETEATIWLEAPTGTYQTGWARVWEEGGSLFVDVDVSPPEAVAQPAHIHQGDCSNLGVVDYRLENIIGGLSLTEIPGRTLKSVATGDLAINLHLSFADFSTFTACGAIPALSDSVLSNPDEPVVPEIDDSDYDY